MSESVQLQSGQKESQPMHVGNMAAKCYGLAKGGCGQLGRVAFQSKIGGERPRSKMHAHD